MEQAHNHPHHYKASRIRKIRRMIKLYKLRVFGWFFYAFLAYVLLILSIPMASFGVRGLIIKSRVPFPFVMISKRDLTQLSEDIENYKLMVPIVKEFKYSVSPELLLRVMESIDKHLPVAFPNGEFTKADILTLISIESQFDPYSVGTRGEFGLMQILNYHTVLKEITPTFDIVEDNIQAGIHVLADKFRRQKDYKTTLIAYNGLVKEGASYRDNYYKMFLAKRKIYSEYAR